VTIPRVRALDGLRGAAVAGVLLFHSGHLLGGYLGVDLFFVLSGFLITSLLLAEAGSRGSIALGAFWARRARRLLPALAGMLVGVAAYCLVFAAPSELAQIRGDALATIGYVANWRDVFAKQDYWALFRAPSPLQHSWSLAIEEQFYVVWPLAFFGLLIWWRQATAKAVLLTALVCAVASSALMYVLYDPTNTNRVYYGTDTRAAAILLGIALAAALAAWGPVRGRAARVALEVAGIAGVVVLAVAWMSLSGQSATLYRGGFFVCGAAAVAVMAAAAHPEAGPVARVFSFRPLCLLGLISYGVYLWHWPIFVVLNESRTGYSGWTLFAMRVALTLAISVASFFVLERPIRHGAFNARALLVATPAVALVLVGMVLVTTSTTEPTLTAASTRPDSAAAAVQESARTPGATRVMVVGNSVAYQLAIGMKKLKTSPPFVVFNDGVVACAFPWGVPRQAANAQQLPEFEHCDRNWTSAVRQFKPQVVLVILQCCSSTYRFGKTWLSPCDGAYEAIFRRDYEHAVRTLGSTGARVVLTTAPYTGEEELFRDARAGLDCSNRLRTQLASRMGLQVVDLLRWTCPNGVPCRRQEGNVVLRPDHVHFTGQGGEIAGRWILEQAGVIGSSQSAAPGS
jgi:peptidoglycan/LPS O-acetylase OafA/YrhL